MTEMFDQFEAMYCYTDYAMNNTSGFVAGAYSREQDFPATFYMNDKPVSVKLDTGAKCNILSLKTLQSLNSEY